MHWRIKEMLLMLLIVGIICLLQKTVQDAFIVLLLTAIIWLIAPPRFLHRQKSARKTLAGTILDDLFLWLMYGGIVILGVFFITTSSLHSYQGWRAAQWQKVDATVVESRTLQSGRDFKNDTVYYRPYVRYRYTVDGRGYESDRLQFGLESTADRASVEEQVAGVFAPGASVVAYVNPRDPSSATLEVGFRRWRIIPAVIGLLITPIGLYALWVQWQATRAKFTGCRRAEAGV